jgi:hypothetical protein
MKKRIFAAILALMLVALCFAGCSAQYSGEGAVAPAEAKNDMSYDMDYAMEEPVADYVEAESAPGKAMDSGDSSLNTMPTDESRKIIRNGDISIDTTDFDASVAKLNELVEKYGGYTSNANVYVSNNKYSLHSGSYTLRIPAENFDAFIAERSGIGAVQNINVWSDDVTDQYFDMNARLESLETKRTRLLELLEKAETMENIIALETELSDTIYQIESLTGSLRRLDDQINYSSIFVNINEVREVTDPVELPKTLGERISQNFKNTLSGMKTGGENFLVWFIGASPALLLIGVVVAAVIVVVVRVKRKKSAAKKEDKTE